jgi:hypothetical protein
MEALELLRSREDPQDLVDAGHGERAAADAAVRDNFYFEVFVVGVATIGAAVLGLAMANDSSNIFTSASRP